MRQAVEILLSTGKRVVLAPLTVTEQVKALRGAGKGSGLAAASEAGIAGARMAVREIDGQAVSFVQLLGGQWDSKFSMRETMQVLRQFGVMHSPPEGAFEAATATATSAPTGTAYTLPDTSNVVMRELPYGQVQGTFALADKESSPAAADYVVTLAGVKASIVTINGAPAVWPAGNDAQPWIDAWPFDVPTTALLMALWRELHGFGDERPTVVPTTA